MSSRTKVIIMGTAIVFSFMLCGMFFRSYLRMRSEARLSQLLENVEVGLPLSEATKNLGQPTRVLTKQADVEAWGTIKEKEITEECNLYMFPYWGLPHKYILLYEDKDSNMVRFVTLKSM